ncbi:phosphatase PAP2 family protein [Paenibacillus sp. YAF4_2]|uniref:phosphatase PAP2 family protein n=1 Tax=Paenibacillus sp. YAF4_2 TaxID=3233085 RepID=UPI003F9A4507
MRIKNGQNLVLFRSFIFTIVVLIFFFWIAQLIKAQRIVAFDKHLSDAIQGLRSSGLTFWMKGFTNFGSGLYVSIIIVIFAVGLAVIGYRRELIFYLGVIGCSLLLNLSLKGIFHRARPDIHRIIDASGFSFPSGHSMSAFTLYGITIYFIWKHLKYGWLRIGVILAGIAIVLMIGISRIYLGVHYPSDVIGGYLVSAAWMSISIALYERFLEKRWMSKKMRQRSENKS